MVEGNTSDRLSVLPVKLDHSPRDVLPSAQWPVPRRLQHPPGACGRHRRRFPWVTERQHRGVPGRAAPSAGHGCHRPGSPRGVLLKMGHAGETVRRDTQMKTWGFCKPRWLLGELQELQDTPRAGALHSLPASSSGPTLGTSPTFLMAPPASPASGLLLLTELVKDVQQLTGHNAASSAKVHSSRETRARLTLRILPRFGPSSPTTSPVHHSL